MFHLIVPPLWGLFGLGLSQSRENAILMGLCMLIYAVFVLAKGR
jgi:hypothetical protein